MTTLLTGATGFLGGMLARKLVERGDRVRAFVRATADRDALDRLGVECVPGDVTDRESVAAAVKGCDRVFHSAAIVRTWVRDRADFERVNVAGTRNVIEEALEAGATRIVYTSTFLVLKPSEQPANEETRADETEVQTDYARSKWLARRVVEGLAAGGAPVVMCFPGIIFGPGKLTEGNLLVNWILRFARGTFPGYLGKGDRLWNFAFVEDVARGHLLADEKGGPGRSYVLGGENASIRSVMETVAELAGTRLPTKHVSYGLAKFVGFLQLLRASLTGHEPEVTPGVVETFRNHWALDSSRAKSELGYRPTPLREALERTVAWLRRERLID